MERLPAGGAREGERHRLFCALLLPDAAVAALVAWQARALTGCRPVDPGQLHLTLAYLGERPAADLPAIAAALRQAVGRPGPLLLRCRDYRETRSVAMLTFDDVGLHATALATRLHDRLAALGLYEREARPWLPHVTVGRFRTPPGLRPAPPALEVMPSDAAVFISRLRPTGAVHESVETVALGG